MERGRSKLITAFLKLIKLELYETVSVKRLVYRGNITKFLKVGKEAAVLRGHTKLFWKMVNFQTLYCPTS